MRDERLESRRGAEQQPAGAVIADAVRMRYAARSDERVTGRQAMAHSSGELQRHLALEHVEALLVRVMDVER